MIITQSDTSDEAVAQFEARMEKLRRLDISKGYMELLNEVDRLRYPLPPLNTNIRSSNTL